LYFRKYIEIPAIKGVGGEKILTIPSSRLERSGMPACIGQGEIYLEADLALLSTYVVLDFATIRSK